MKNVQGSGVFFRIGDEACELTEDNYQLISELARSANTDIRSILNGAARYCLERIDTDPGMLAELVANAEAYQQQFDGVA